MSIQWIFSAGFLYAEIFVIMLFLLPIISPKRWKQLFNSYLLRLVQKKANHFFMFFIAGLSVLLLDAIREIYKYAEKTPKAEAFNLNLQQGREFRAQRNLYITGIALFLSVVIKRLAFLLSRTADLMEEVDSLNKVQMKLEAMSNETTCPSAPPAPKQNDQQEARSRSIEKKKL